MLINLQWDAPEELLRQLETQLAQNQAKIRRVPEMAIRRATFELLALVKQLSPRKTSKLTSSITAQVKRLADDLVEGRVGTHLYYARYVEEGTGIYGPKGKPFIVQAKNAKALFWGARQVAAMTLKRQPMYRTNATKSGLTTNASKGNQFVFAKKVVIQGMKPRAPFARAVAQFLPRFLEIINEEAGKAAA